MLPKHFAAAEQLALGDHDPTADLARTSAPALPPGSTESTLATQSTAREDELPEGGERALVELQLSQMKVPELKEQCKEKGLAFTGTKDVLKKRLVDHILEKKQLPGDGAPLLNKNGNIAGGLGAALGAEQGAVKRCVEELQLDGAVYEDASGRLLVL